MRCSRVLVVDVDAVVEFVVATECVCACVLHPMPRTNSLALAAFNLDLLANLAKDRFGTVADAVAAVTVTEFPFACRCRQLAKRFLQLVHYLQH